MNEIIVEDGDILVRALRRAAAAHAEPAESAQRAHARHVRDHDAPYAGMGGGSSRRRDPHRRRRRPRFLRRRRSAGALRRRQSGQFRCRRNSGRPNTSSMSLIARYPKPVIVIMDGLVMGGGVGLVGPCGAPRRHRALRGRLAGSRHRLFPGHRRLLSVGASAGSFRLLPGADRQPYRARPMRSIAASPTFIFLQPSLPRCPRRSPNAAPTTEVRERLGEFAEPPAPGRLPAARAMDRSLLQRGAMSKKFSSDCAMHTCPTRTSALADHAKGIADLAQDHAAQCARRGVLQAG